MIEIVINPRTKILINRATSVGTFNIKNNSMRCVAYKIKTKKPKDFIVRPNIGKIIPMQEVTVDVTLVNGITPSSEHEFLIEVYEFDWIKEVENLSKYLKMYSPKILFSHRMCVGYDESGSAPLKEDETAQTFFKSRIYTVLAQIYLVLHAIYLIRRLFE